MASIARTVLRRGYATASSVKVRILDLFRARILVENPISRRTSAGCSGPSDEIRHEPMKSWRPTSARSRVCGLGLELSHEACRAAMD